MASKVYRNDNFHFNMAVKFLGPKRRPKKRLPSSRIIWQNFDCIRSCKKLSLFFLITKFNMFKKHSGGPVCC